jgi:hypothetical protein
MGKKICYRLKNVRQFDLFETLDLPFISHVKTFPSNRDRKFNPSQHSLEKFFFKVGKNLTKTKKNVHISIALFRYYSSLKVSENKIKITICERR